MSEADTRAKLIDPALHSSGWTEDLIKREETVGRPSPEYLFRSPFPGPLLEDSLRNIRTRWRVHIAKDAQPFQDAFRGSRIPGVDRRFDAVVHPAD